MRRLAPAAAFLLSLSGCSGDAERLVLRDFFGAARLHDRTALAALATTDFAPNAQGVVLRFDVVAVSDVSRHPMSSELHDQTLARISLAPVRDSDSGPPPAGGERWTKEVAIAAVVRRPDGETMKRELLVTLERTVVTAGGEVAGRWIVTEVLDRGPRARQAS